MKRIIIALSILFMAWNLHAQEVIWKLTYDVGIPFSSTKEFANQVSWRGLGLDFDRFVGDNLSVGMGFSWSVFLEKEADSDFQLENILLHGTQVRYINNIPLTVRIGWYQPLSNMELYGTLGAGAAWQELRREVGTWAFTGNYWQFAMIPEAGIIFPVGSRYLNARLKYVQAFETSEAPSLSYLSIGVGLAW